MISVEYTLPSGEVVSISFEDRYDSRLQPTIDFQLPDGEIVLATMRLNPDQKRLLESLNSVFMESVGEEELFGKQELATAHELHERNLCMLIVGKGTENDRAWITFNGRKLLSKLS